MLFRSNIKEKVKDTMSDSLSISVPSKPEYVSIVRLTASAIAYGIGFNIEQIEDIKVAISEACTNVIKHGKCEISDNYQIDFLMDEEKMTICIEDNGNGFCRNDVCEPDLSSPKEGGLGIFIIQTLMDDVRIATEVGKGTSIQMIKYLGVDF